MIYILLGLFVILGIASILIIILDAFGWADVKPDWDRPWYTNLLSIIILFFGYGLLFSILIVSLPVTIPLGIVASIKAKEQKQLEIQKKQDDIAKFEAWKRLPR